MLLKIIVCIIKEEEVRGGENLLICLEMYNKELVEWFYFFEVIFLGYLE